MPQTGQDGSKFDENSWNDQIVEMAKSTPEGHPARGFFIYMASKVLGEKAAWDFVIKEKVRSLHSQIVRNVEADDECFCLAFIRFQCCKRFSSSLDQLRHRTKSLYITYRSFPGSALANYSILRNRQARRVALLATSSS